MFEDAIHVLSTRIAQIKNALPSETERDPLIAEKVSCETAIHTLRYCAKHRIGPHLKVIELPPSIPLALDAMGRLRSRRRLRIATATVGAQYVVGSDLRCSAHVLACHGSCRPPLRITRFGPCCQACSTPVTGHLSKFPKMHQPFPTLSPTNRGTRAGMTAHPALLHWPLAGFAACSVCSLLLESLKRHSISGPRLSSVGPFSLHPPQPLD